MLFLTGLVCLLFGMVCWIGQLVSVLDFAFAQRLGLQEKSENAHELFSRLELATARWDVVVLWSLPAAGILMLLGHESWPLLAIIAGALHLDTGGREMAKVLALRSASMRTGSAAESRLYFGVMGTMVAIGLWCLVYGVLALTS